MTDTPPRSTILELGLHPDVPEDVYHTDPCERPSLSASIAKISTQKKRSSAAHVYHAHPSLGANSKPSSKAQEFGSALHSLTLGGPKIVVLTDIYEKTGKIYSDYATKVAKEFKEEALAAGEIPLLDKEWKKIQRVHEAIERQLDAFGIKLGGDNEVTAVWEDPHHYSEKFPDAPPTLCRCRFDNLSEDRLIINELKSIESSDPFTIKKQISNFGYHTAAAAYLEAIETLLPEMAGRVAYRMIFVEKSAPYIVTPARLSGENLLVGKMKWAKAKGLFHECLNSDTWPGYTDTILTIDAQPWDLEELVLAEEAANVGS